MMDPEDDTKFKVHLSKSHYTLKLPYVQLNPHSETLFSFFSSPVSIIMSMNVNLKHRDT